MNDAFHKFAPLTDAERVAVPLPRGQTEYDGELVSPILADAPDAPKRHWTLGEPSQVWTYRDAQAATLFHVLRFDPPRKRKVFLPLSLWRDAAGLSWRWNHVSPPRPLYNLDKLAARPDAPVVICEGEKSAHAAARIFPDSVCVTSPGGSGAEAQADWTPLAGRKVLIWPDCDMTGAKYAGRVAHFLHDRQCEVSIIDAAALASLSPNGGKREPAKKGWDAADAGDEWQDLDALRRAAHEFAKEPPLVATRDDELGEPDEIDLEISQLAKLRTVDYEQIRREAAAKLSIRASILDKLVAAARPPDESAPGKGRPLDLPAPEPWPEPVNGAALVPELTGAILKYVVLTENDALAVAMWILHAYCFDAFACTPRLAITAPEKRCGKTTLLDVIGLLVPRPLSTANISAAATFRTIEAVRPTLLIDEADTFLSENEELRGILNSGHRKGGQVIRTVGDDFEVRAFSTHTPVAIAQIGKLPDTLADRSIHISMKRRAPSETVSRLRHGRTPELSEVAMKAARWIADNADAIRECDPNIPDAIFNRAADNWAPLFAVAEVAGSAVAAQARHVALGVCGVEEEPSLGAMLLADIRSVFEEKGCGRMTSADLVAELVAVADRPWCECNRGKALTQNQLARRLKPFGIGPKTVRAGGGRLKGYELDAFSDLFARYIPGFQTPRQMNEVNDLGEDQTVTRAPDVTVRNQPNKLISLDCHWVTDQNTQNGHLRENSATADGVSDPDDAAEFEL
jgi:predicted DNA-binding protein (UPF0251 family)